jgi:hypothetical protein
MAEGKKGQAKAGAPKIESVDTEAPAIFADSIQNIALDNATMRIDFSITRSTGASPGKSMVFRRTRTCHLILTPAAADELYKKLGTMAKAVAQAAQAGAR